MIKYFIVFLSFFTLKSPAQISGEKLSYHLIKTDSNGNILPWYSEDLGESYDHIINIVWKFWDTMRTDMNGLPYYMNHQVWKRNVNDSRGIGGDQISMALSSWRLYYNYSGNPKVLENMKFMADYYLSHSLSSLDCKWPNIPYPYNTLVYSGIYDGDMISGIGFTQPDKAGSFGYELINLYKMTGNLRYINAAIQIANTLSSHVESGNNNVSPLPFRVNAKTGEVGSLIENKKVIIKYTYTSNWSETLELFSELISMKRGDWKSYKKSFHIILKWMKNYPLKTNKWGPFFEDVGLWSDTQINAVTFATYILNHTELFPNWKNDVRGILDWVYRELGNEKWKMYGVTVVNEQTDYRVQGSSHTARQGATELLYASKTRDLEAKKLGQLQLNWSTYMVNDDGENSYPNSGNETWMTDGYGDYVRHYLRAMEAYPSLAPENQNHLINSTSVIKIISYSYEEIYYEVFDKSSEEVLRLTSKPQKIIIDQRIIPESLSLSKSSWLWEQLETGGILRINNRDGNKVLIKL